MMKTQKKRKPLPKSFLIGFRRFIKLPIYINDINKSEIEKTMINDIHIFTNRKYISYFSENLLKFDPIKNNKEKKFKSLPIQYDFFKNEEKEKKNNPNPWYQLFQLIKNSNSQKDGIPILHYQIVNARVEQVYKELDLLQKQNPSYSLREIILHYLLICKVTIKGDCPFCFGYTITDEERETKEIFEEKSENNLERINKTIIKIGLGKISKKTKIIDEKEKKDKKLKVKDFLKRNTIKPKETLSFLSELMDNNHALKSTRERLTETQEVVLPKILQSSKHISSFLKNEQFSSGLRTQYKPKTLIRPSLNKKFHLKSTSVQKESQYYDFPHKHITVQSFLTKKDFYY